MEHALRLPGRSGNLKKYWMDEEDIRALLFIARMDVRRAARPVPRLGSVQRNPVFAPRSHGKMAPWHPMPPHAPCMDPWTRFPFKFEWDLAGRPDTVGPARDFRVLAHGMIIMGQGRYYYCPDLNLAPEL